MTNHDMVLYVFTREGFLKDVVMAMTKELISFTTAKTLVYEELTRLNKLI